MMILVTGSRGQLGSALLASAPESIIVSGRSREECDITDPDSVSAAFEETRPDVVINAAAYTAVDQAELESGKAFAVNATGARNVAAAALKAGARTIHISTDYVFDGAQQIPYTTASRPKPLNTYGKSKLEGESAVLATDKTALVIRTGWLYSEGGNNFLSKIRHQLVENRPVRVVNDQFGVPTRASDLALAIWACVGISGQRGVRHWVNDGTASWYDFARRIQDVAFQIGILRNRVPVMPIPSSSYASAAVRPSYSVLDSSELWNEIGRARHWHNALADLLEAVALSTKSAKISHS